MWRNQAMPSQRQLAGKRRADHYGLEMHSVFTTDVGVGAGQAGFYHLANLVGVHGLAGGLK